MSRFREAGDCSGVGDATSALPDRANARLLLGDYDGCVDCWTAPRHRACGMTRVRGVWSGGPPCSRGPARATARLAGRRRVCAPGRPTRGGQYRDETLRSPTNCGLSWLSCGACRARTFTVGPVCWHLGRCAEVVAGSAPSWAGDADRGLRRRRRLAPEYGAVTYFPPSPGSSAGEVRRQLGEPAWLEAGSRAMRSRQITRRLAEAAIELSSHLGSAR
jgi:hypothetical protein